MDYETIRMNYAESIKLRSNECYAKTKIKSEEKKRFTVDDILPDTSDTPSQSVNEVFNNSSTVRSTKIKRKAIIQMVLLYCAVAVQLQ